MKSGKGKTMEIIKTPVITRDLGRGRMNRWNTRHFRTDTILHDAIKMYTSNYIDLKNKQTNTEWTTKSESEYAQWTLVVFLPE